MKTPIVLLLLLVLATFGRGQDRSSVRQLIGTTWTIYFNECRQTDWTNHDHITFLSGGRLQGSTGSWRLARNQLFINAADLYIRNLKVVANGSQMTGTAELGMSNLRDYCVRLVREGTTRVETGSSTSASDWQSFWAAFRAAVNRKNRLALRRMMASRFAYPGEGAVSPNVWLKSIDSQKVWPQVWRELQQSVAKGAKPLVDESGLETRTTNDNALIFRRGDDNKWRWVGFMGD
jgi:hypothetical protein